jgi:hypothetical protein
MDLMSGILMVKLLGSKLGDKQAKAWVVMMESPLVAQSGVQKVHWSE